MTGAKVKTGRRPASGPGTIERFLHSARVLRVDEVEQAPADALLHLVAGHALDGAVLEDDVAAFIDNGHELEGVRDERSIDFGMVTLRTRFHRYARRRHATYQG